MEKNYLRYELYKGTIISKNLKYLIQILVLRVHILRIFYFWPGDSLWKRRRRRIAHSKFSDLTRRHAHWLLDSRIVLSTTSFTFPFVLISPFLIVYLFGTPNIILSILPRKTASSFLWWIVSDQVSAAYVTAEPGNMTVPIIFFFST